MRVGGVIDCNKKGSQAAGTLSWVHPFGAHNTTGAERGRRIGLELCAAAFTFWGFSRRCVELMIVVIN
jgi:hypothetical protein